MNAAIQLPPTSDCLVYLKSSLLLIWTLNTMEGRRRRRRKPHGVSTELEILTQMVSMLPIMYRNMNRSRGPDTDRKIHVRHISLLILLFG